VQPPQKVDNLFDKFNSAKAASSDSLVEEFKLKMAARMAKKLAE
jgi:hypothetical protein